MQVGRTGEHLAAGAAFLNCDPYSLQTIERLLHGMSAVPRLGFPFIDVRDVADLHLAR
jgi:hypothetical protein